MRPKHSFIKSDGHRYRPIDDLEKSTDHEFCDADDSPSSHSSSSSSSSRSSSYGSGDQMLTVRHAAYPARRKRLKYLYKIPDKILRWLSFILMATVVIFGFSMLGLSLDSDRKLQQYRSSTVKKPAWGKFDILQRYYGGLRTLVSWEKNIPEYPPIEQEQQQDNKNRNGSPAGPWNSKPTSIAVSAAEDPYLRHGPRKTRQVEADEVHECFLDKDDTVRLPKVHSYKGTPRGFPNPVVGSYEAIGLPNETCYDRFGRLGPYGFGYSLARGGSGVGLEGEISGGANVWKDVPRVDYGSVKWADAQRRCIEKNKHRFVESSLRDATTVLPATMLDVNSSEPSVPVKSPEAEQERGRLSRTAIVLRTWSDFKYTPEVMMFLRSLIAEMALLSGGEYTVHFLVHVKDDNTAIWADAATYERTLKESLPAEFEGMATLWTERQMGLIYGGLPDSFYMKLPVHGVYRSVYMALQWFAQHNPQFEHFWNVEMDIRYTGHWYTLLEAAREWAKKQPRKGLWERNDRFYIPSVHGSWEDFKHTVRVQTEMALANPASAQARGASSKWSSLYGGSDGPSGGYEEPQSPGGPVWGPLAPAETQPLPTDQIPPHSYAQDAFEWGVGEEADLMTMGPIWDPAGTDWRLARDVTGYNLTGTGTGGSSNRLPPRRASIISTARMSRRLLDAMHAETALQRHTMFSEMWPGSVALHHGLKAVAVPHPVYVDRAWPLDYLAATLNRGAGGVAAGGGPTSVFGRRLEHNLQGLSWYFNSKLAPRLWTRWLGFKADGKGGEQEEMQGEGRMCLPAMLIHPVKDVKVVVEGTRIAGEEDM